MTGFHIHSLVSNIVSTIGDSFNTIRETHLKDDAGRRINLFSEVQTDGSIVTHTLALYKEVGEGVAVELTTNDLRQLHHDIGVRIALCETNEPLKTVG